jgi:hypothetical protein
VEEYMKYTVTEFRKNTREILDSIDRGAEVTIVRYDKEYVINGTVVPEPKDFMMPLDFKGNLKDKAVSMGVGLVNDKTTIPKGYKVVKPKWPESALLTSEGSLIPSIDPCPHGYAKGMCKKADCNKKYS